MHPPFRVLLLLMIGTLMIGGLEARDEDDVLRARVDSILAKWRAKDAASTPAVADELVALGQGISPYLCRLLDTRSVKLPVPAVASALGRLGSRKSIASLEGLAGSSLASERLAAVDGLGAMRFRECIPVLVAALSDVDEAVVERASSVLLTQRYPQREVVSTLRYGLRKATDKARHATLLARLGGSAAHDALVALLGESDEAAQLAALEGLWILSRSEDGAIVTRVLESARSVAVLKQACLFVGRVRHAAATRVLIDLLSEPRVAANAHWALKKITGLKLRASPDLWGQWWERLGKKQLERNAALRTE